LTRTLKASHLTLDALKLAVDKGWVVWRQFLSKDETLEILLLVIPQSLQEEVLWELHSGLVGSHLGEGTMA